MANPERTHDRVTAIYDCLARARRRCILRCLNDAEKPLALADLAAEVANRESQRSDVDPETVKDVYLSLYHVHIPKLADADLVQYDKDRRTVGLSEYPDILQDSETSSDNPMPSPNEQ